jgi:parallel beta-helix repeat protein
MAHKIQIKRGNKADIPVLNDGEMGLCIDTQEVFVGCNGTNIPVNTNKRTARFVIGTSTSGWTEKDCDYLCDGVDDQVEINQAIQDLPASGGEIVLLDGTYSISLWVRINKSNVTLRGNGWSTIIRRDFTAGANQGAIAFSGDNVSVRDLVVDANKDNYGGIRNYGITKIISDNIPNNCTIKGLLVKNSTNAGISIDGNNSTIINNTVINSGTGLRSSGKNNIFSNNIVLDNDVGMYLQNSEGNLITSNIFMRGTGLSSDYTTSQYTIRLAGTNNHYNLIASNFCMGKAPVVGGGTGNSAWGNKFDNTDDLP